MLKAFVKSLDDVEEDYRSLYKEIDGGFLLEVSAVNGYDLQNIDGLKTTLGKYKKQATDLQASLNDFRDEEGNLIDISTLRAKAEKADELEGKVPEVKRAVEAATKEVEKIWQGKLDKATEALTGRTAQLQRVIVDEAATKALSKHGGNIRLLLPHVRSQVRTVEADGEFRAEVVDSEGNPRVTLRDGRTVDMTIDDLVVEMSESTDFLSAFKGSGQSGNGSAGDHGEPGVAKGFVSRESLHRGSYDLEKVASGDVRLRE